jgi:23S rRNA (pseudouridine1915-N3)-methyltransferase
MRIMIIAVGRARQGPEAALFEEYWRRLAWPLVLKEVEERRKLPAAGLRAREGELLLAALPGGARPTVVALDERGKSLASEAFAARIGTWRDGGIDYLAFLIGGAGGLDDKVRARADLVLSLGPMTWPHLLARAMLAEQLYRAQTIIGGHPYHRA